MRWACATREAIQPLGEKRDNRLITGQAIQPRTSEDANSPRSLYAQRAEFEKRVQLRDHAEYRLMLASQSVLPAERMPTCSAGKHVKKRCYPSSPIFVRLLDTLFIFSSISRLWYLGCILLFTSWNIQGIILLFIFCHLQGMLLV